MATTATTVPPASPIPWYAHIPLHVSTAATIVDFLRETSPTPVYGTAEYRFRYIGSVKQVDNLRNQLRVALARVRKKAANKGIAVTPFVMIVSQPETHTVDNKIFHIITLSRKLGSSNPFVATTDLINPEVVLAIGDRNHPPTKMIVEMLQELRDKNELHVSMLKWDEVTSVMWLVAHDYVKLKHIAVAALGVFIPVNKPQHINPNNSSNSNN